MLLTFTPNLALDRTLIAPGFRHLDVCRVQRAIPAAGGKGINVVRVARNLGYPAKACGPLAGETGRTVAELAASEGIDGEWSWLRRGETRTCTLVVDPDAPDDIALNERGPSMLGAEWGELARLVRRLAADADALACCGSLPLDVPPATYLRLLNELATNGTRVILDISGPVLEGALDLPLFAIKVNGRELGDVLGRTLASIDDALDAAASVVARGPALVVVTLGAAGAVAVSAEERCVAVPPDGPIVSTVGSGDALLAGLVVALLRGSPLIEALRLGVACGTVNARHVGGGIAPADEIAALLSEVEARNIA